MPSLSDSRHKRGHPKGQRFQMTAKWKADAIAELDRRDRDPTAVGWYGRAYIALAEALGVDKSTIGKLLKDKTVSSALVPRISKILGIQQPVLGTDAEIADLVAQLDDESRYLAIVLLRKLIK
jgi:hypothetical protein